MKAKLLQLVECKNDYIAPLVHIREDSNNYYLVFKTVKERFDSVLDKIIALKSFNEDHVAMIIY